MAHMLATAIHSSGLRKSSRPDQGVQRRRSGTARTDLALRTLNCRNDAALGPAYDDSAWLSARIRGRWPPAQSHDAT